MISLSNLSGCELVGLANLFSILISQEVDTEELISYASFFTIVGDSLAAIAASPNNCNNLRNQHNTNNTE